MILKKYQSYKIKFNFFSKWYLKSINDTQNGTQVYHTNYEYFWEYIV